MHISETNEDLIDKNVTLPATTIPNNPTDNENANTPNCNAANSGNLGSFDFSTVGKQEVSDGSCTSNCEAATKLLSINDFARILSDNKVNSEQGDNNNLSGTEGNDKVVEGESSTYVTGIEESIKCEDQKLPPTSVAVASILYSVAPGVERPVRCSKKKHKGYHKVSSIEQYSLRKLSISAGETLSSTPASLNSDSVQLNTIDRVARLDIFDNRPPSSIQYNYGRGNDIALQSILANEAVRSSPRTKQAQLRKLAHPLGLPEQHQYPIQRMQPQQPPQRHSQSPSPTFIIQPPSRTGTPQANQTSAESGESTGSVWDDINQEDFDVQNNSTTPAPTLATLVLENTQVTILEEHDATTSIATFNRNTTLPSRQGIDVTNPNSSHIRSDFSNLMVGQHPTAATTIASTPSVVIEPSSSTPSFASLSLHTNSIGQSQHRGGVASLHRPPQYSHHVPLQQSRAIVARPEVGINAEEDDDSSFFTDGNDMNSTSVSPACGWTEVMASTATIGGVTNQHHNSTMPSPRSLHSAALLNGVMYIFGGYDGTQRVNSFHAYNFADKRWSPVLPSANSGSPPSPRDRHVSVAFANSFYVHGGFDGIARDASLFSFDFSTMAWREVIASQGRPPSARHSHAAVVHDHSMYIFGGYDGSYKADLHEFDFTVSRWSSVPAVGRRPRPRYRATCVVYKNYMILYGGHDGTKHLSDTFTFDFDTLTWSTLITEGIQPIPRDSHVAVVHGNSMYVFGGSSGIALNDFHELQLPVTNSGSGGCGSHKSSTSLVPLSPAASHTSTTTNARWRPVRTSQNENTHQPHRRFCHVAVTYNDSMYVFGGYDGSDRLNSFIKFDFAMYDLSFDIPPSTLIHDFRSFVNNERLSDITFIVENEFIYAHKLMLMRCSYFQALFNGHMRESDMDTIRIEQVRYPIFLGILEYLYTDQLSSMPFHTAMEYFEAADLFCIPRLKTMCEKRMLQHITIENAASIFHAADIHSATALRQKAKKYMLTHFEEVSKTSTFEEMGRQNVDLVFELLHSR